MAQIVSENFREILYSGEADHTVSLTIGNTPIDIENIKSIKISDPIIDKTSETFYIGTFVGKQVEIEFYKPEEIDLTGKVHLEIGTMVNEEYEMLPIGNFNIDTPTEDYYSNCKIVALDDSSLFKPNIDTVKWLKAAGIRAIKTIAQTAIATIGASATMGDVNWAMVGSASLLSGIISILTSIGGIPEVKEGE